MSATRSLTVTLPVDLAEEVEARVAAGDYPSQSDIIRASLAMLLAQGPETEAWVRHEVAATYDAYKEDPSRATPADEVLSRLEQRFAAEADTRRGT